MATVTSEKNTMLALGEKLREDPQTIWLSIPVLGLAILWAKVTRDREMEAGGSGHLGLTFRLLYKHHWKQAKLLDIAYAFFSNAAQIGTGSGQPSVRMAMGGVSMEKKDYQQALRNYQEGFLLAKKMKDPNQAAFLQSHVGIAQTKLGLFLDAKKNLETAMKILTKALRDAPNSLYLQVWISNAELGMSEWYLATGDKMKAKLWAAKVGNRARKFDLKTRKVDAQNLLKRINLKTVIVSVFHLTALRLATLITKSS